MASPLAHADESAAAGTAALPALPPDPSPIAVSVGLRSGVRAQNQANPGKLDQLSLDTLYVEPRFGGRMDRVFAWQANFNVGVPGAADPWTQNPLRVMDLIAKIELHPLLNVWVGRFPVPADRSNMSGPYYMSPWSYPGLYPTAFVGPKTGATGRDDGVTVWGQVAEGKLKYFLGAFELVAPQAAMPGHHPLWSGRVAWSLVGAEPGFYDAGTYYGAQDIVALGFGVQLRKNGAGTVDARRDLRSLMVDLLAEKSWAGVGTFSLEGAGYDFGQGQAVRRAFYVLGSYLTPGPIGWGRLQPLVRWQRTTSPRWTILDAFVTWVIRGYDLRVAAGYQRTDVGAGPVGHAVQLGLQMQK